jgi:hypothetical protein
MIRYRTPPYMKVSTVETTPSTSPGFRASQRSDQFLIILFGLVLIHAFAVLIVGISKPTLDAHSFRQSQTALSIYWLLHGSPILRYETPVLGYPWSIPFEFPLYQWLVAIVVSVGVSIEAAGRLVAFAFYLGILALMRSLFWLLRLSTRAFLVTAILFLCSPLYLYWSRTVMVESCALFFSALFLMLLVRAIRLPKFARLPMVGAILAGSAAALAKSTTFPAFLAVGGLEILRDTYVSWREHHLSMRLPVLTGSVAACIISLLVGYTWVAYSDAIKAANPFGRSLMSTSSGFLAWNFGTLPQRFSLHLWGWIFPLRIMGDTAGFCYLFGAILIIYAVKRRYHSAIIVSCIIAFFLPIMTFTNLYTIHSYYIYASGIFMIVAMGLGVAALYDSGRHVLGVLALLFLVSGEYALFYYRFAGYLVEDYSENRMLGLAALAHDKTQPGEGLLGLGFGWSSELPYLSQRKALLLNDDTGEELMQRVFENPQAFFGNYRLGAIVYCRSNLQSYGDRVAIVNKFLAGRPILGEVSGCLLVSPSRGDDTR